MPAFGSNSITCAFARRILYEPTRGFRLSDRIVSAIDRFVGALSRFIVSDEPGVFNRWLYIYPFVGGTDWTHALNLADAPDAGYQGGRGFSGDQTYAPTGKFNRFAITWSGNVTHNQFGITMNAGGSANTNCDMADIVRLSNAWNRKTHGIYSRTNNIYNNYDFGAVFTEPRNGYTYQQGMLCRYTDGTCISDLVFAWKTGVTTTSNRASVAVSDSLGLFTDNQRGPYLGISHYIYKRGFYIGGENAGEVGMGYGDSNVPATMGIGPSLRNYAFFFSTRYNRTLEATKNYDGTGGQMTGSNSDFNYFVEQLQVALLRNV